MKTFRFSIPEPKLSAVERKQHLERDQRPQSLTDDDYKLLRKWHQDRRLGFEAYRIRELRKMILISAPACAAIFLVDQPYGWSMLFGVFATVCAEWIIGFKKTFKKNEERYREILARGTFGDFRACGISEPKAEEIY